MTRKAKTIVRTLLCSVFFVSLLACGGKKPTSDGATSPADSLKIAETEESEYPKKVELTVTKPTPINTKEFNKTFAGQLNDVGGTQKLLADQLLALDNTGIAIIPKAEKVLIAVLSSVSKEQADSLIDTYRSYHNLYVELLMTDPYYTQVSDGFYASFDDFDNLPTAYQSIAEEAKKSGFCLTDWGEGMCGFERCPEYLLSLFSPYVTDATKEYLTIETFENANPFLFDAGVCITNVELGDRIITFENYLKKYPDALKAPDIMTYHSNYIGLLFNGCDNTPVFEYNEEGERSKLNSEVYQEYQTIIKNHPDSDLAKLLRDYCKLLSKNKLRHTAEVEEFLTERVGFGSDYEG